MSFEVMCFVFRLERKREKKLTGCSTFHSNFESDNSFQLQMPNIRSEAVSQTQGVTLWVGRAGGHKGTRQLHIYIF